MHVHISDIDQRDQHVKSNMHKILVYVIYVAKSHEKQPLNLIDRENYKGDKQIIQTKKPPLIRFPISK